MAVKKKPNLKAVAKRLEAAQQALGDLRSHWQSQEEALAAKESHLKAVQQRLASASDHRDSAFAEAREANRQRDEKIRDLRHAIVRQTELVEAVNNLRLQNVALTGRIGLILKSEWFRSEALYLEACEAVRQAIK